MSVYATVHRCVAAINLGYNHHLHFYFGKRNFGQTDKAILIVHELGLFKWSDTQMCANGSNGTLKKKKKLTQKNHQDQRKKHH